MLTMGTVDMRRVKTTPTGMTLIEIMIVVLIAVMLTTGAVFGLGALRRSNYRSAAVKLVAASQFAYHRAVARGSTVRLAISLDEETLAVEEARGGITLSNGDDEEEDEAVDPWRAAQNRLGSTLEAKVSTNGFGPIMNASNKPHSKYARKPLKGGVNIGRIETAGGRVQRTGDAALYFFPSGRAQKAAIYLEDDDGETVFTVTIDSLTGKGRVQRGEVDFSDAFGGEVRDPG